MLSRKKYLMGLVVGMLLCSAAFAVHTSHFWSKVSEQKGTNGQVVCQWKCGFGNDMHYATTSGYGMCPQKY